MPANLIIKTPAARFVVVMPDPKSALIEFEEVYASDPDAVDVTIRIHGQADRRLKMDRRVVRDTVNADRRMSEAYTPSDFRRRGYEYILGNRPIFVALSGL